MRWSPNLAFGNDTYARNAKEAERITNADLMRSTAVVGSAEGTSASFFPYSSGVTQIRDLERCCIALVAKSKIWTRAHRRTSKYGR